MASVLVLLAPGAEEIEAVTIPDLLVRARQEVVIAALAEVPLVRGSRGIPLGAHIIVDRVAPRAWDLVYLPGGMGSAQALRDDARAQEIIASQLASGRPLAAICAAPLALLPRDLARGRDLTSYPGVRAEVAAGGCRWLDQPVVEDRNLITSQGPATALALGLRLATLLAGGGVADAIAHDLLAVR